MDVALAIFVKTPGLSPCKTRLAKEIGIKITEGNEDLLLSRLDHALYLGRELQKAEYCLVHGIEYIQD